MHFSTLQQWLDWQNSLNPVEINLGLDRIAIVAQNLSLLSPAFPIIAVAGTNGKGSSVILLDAILSAAGYQVGRYTSPHLLDYNERICINNTAVNEQEICQAFDLIETARGKLILTYFEFATLAAMLIFNRHRVDIAILEVGLGGRLDAVNVFDADIALVTAIGIDHTDWLGTDRETIGFEKAGILRPQHSAVCSDPKPPQSLIKHAQQLPTTLYCQNRDFSYQKRDNNWDWNSNQEVGFSNLTLPNLKGRFQLQNAAGVLMVMQLLNQNSSFEIPKLAINQGLKTANLSGRFQILTGKIVRILDVAHNPLAAQELVESLQQQTCQAQTHALVSMLKDKAIGEVFKIMQPVIDCWHIATLNVPRAATIEQLSEPLAMLKITQVNTYNSINTAYKILLDKLPAGDRIVVFGSFHTIAEVLRFELDDSSEANSVE